MYKNLRNNWITEPTKQLDMTVDGKGYSAIWKDIEALYEENKKNPVRLTKLTYTSVNPKPHSAPKH